MSFNNKGKQTGNTTLKDVSEVTQNLPSIEFAFKHYFSKGDLESFKALFEFSNHLTMNFCLEGLQSVCVANIDDPTLSGKLGISKFLFEHSSEYRLYTHLCEYMLTPDIGNVREVGVVGASLFFLAAQRDNKQAFRLLLEQGFDPNSNGITIMGKVAFPLLRSLLLLKNPKPYIDMLLEYEVNVGTVFRSVLYLHPQENFLNELQPNKTGSQTSKHGKVTKTKSFFNGRKASASNTNDNDIIQLLNSAEESVQDLMLRLLFPSLLYLAAQDDHYVLFPKLFEVTDPSPWEVALALAHYANNNTKDAVVAAVRTLDNTEAIQIFSSVDMLKQQVKILEIYKQKERSDLKKFGFFISCANVQKSRVLTDLWNRLKQCEDIEETIRKCESFLSLPLGERQKRDIYVACVILMSLNPPERLSLGAKNDAPLVLQGKYRLMRWCEAAHRSSVGIQEFKQATNFIGWVVAAGAPKTPGGNQLKEAVRTLAYYILGYQLPPVSFIPAERGRIELKSEFLRIFETPQLSDVIYPMACVVNLRETKEVEDITKFFKENLEICEITEETILDAQYSLQADRLFQEYLENSYMQGIDIEIHASEQARKAFVEVPLPNGEKQGINILESLHLAELLLIALKSRPTVQDRENMISQCFTLGNIYIQQKDNIRARHYLTFGLSITDTYLEGSSFKQLEEYRRSEARAKVLDSLLS